MRWFIACLMIIAGPAVWAEVGEGRILKVLPHFIDHQGLHTLSPSLYERDAYQAILRHHPERRGGFRFDIHWRARGAVGADLALRVDLRGLLENEITTHVLELPVEGRRWFATWSDLIFSGPEYEAFGELNAWRVTLWEGERLLAEERSFLWP